MLNHRIEELHRIQHKPTIVLYLSRRDKRIHDNAALFYCYTLTDRVIFGIKPEYIVGNYMQRRFIAEGLSELKGACRQHNIPFVLIQRIDELVRTHCIDCIVVDHSPLRYSRAVDDQLYRYCKSNCIALVRVDAHNIVPYAVVKDDVKSGSAVKKRLLERFGEFVDERYLVERRECMWMSDDGMNDLEGVELRIRDNLDDEKDDCDEEEEGEDYDDGGEDYEDGGEEKEDEEEGEGYEDNDDGGEEEEIQDKEIEHDDEEDENNVKSDNNTERIGGGQTKKRKGEATKSTAEHGGANRKGREEGKRVKMDKKMKTVKERAKMYRAQIKQIIQKHDLYSQYTPRLTGGYSNACCTLSTFIQNNLPIYDKYRNSADQDVQSGVSAYVNDGQISAGDVVRAVIQWGNGKHEDTRKNVKNTKSTKTTKNTRKRNTGFVQEMAGGTGQNDAKSVNVTTYLNEIFVWRETAEYFILRNHNYDNFYGALKWAQDTLTAHLSDQRQHYTLDQLILARTSDPEWNAGQKQMVITGKMHGYVRMYWAKTMLYWFDRPEDAVTVGCVLNDTFSLDGNDGNGYLGVMWCMVGSMDQGFAEKSVVGKVRSMKGIKAKDYVRRWECYQLGRPDEK